MLLLFLTILINSLACWNWGNILLEKITRHQLKEDSLIIHGVMGMILLTTFAGLTGLMGSSNIIFEGLLPFSSLVLFTRKETRVALREQWRLLNIAGFSSIAFLAISLFVLLLMGSASIYHPDTLAYHAPVINWIKNYQAVPGIVHLNNRYGIQSSWFVTAALSSPKFLLGGLSGYNAANLTLLSWFILFLTSKISGIRFATNKLSSVAWLFILVSGWFCFTQIRLTAISASPDFPAAIFSLGGIYFLCKEQHSDAGHWLIAFLFFAMAISIKLFCIPFIIPAVLCKIQWWKKKGFWSTVALGMAGLIIYLPVALRSVIASGYLFYPSAWGRISSLDWAYDSSLAALQEKYITAYARVGDINYEQVDSILAMPYSKWVPSWWSHLHGSDQISIVLAMVSLLIVLLNSKKLFTLSQAWKITVLTSVVGLLLWFLRAPDPRFAWAYLLLLPVVAFRLLQASLPDKLSVLNPAILMNAFTFGLLGFAAYKASREENIISQLLSPASIQSYDISREHCKGILIGFPKADAPCSGMGQPCSIVPCDQLQPRGESVEDGFRAVK